MEAKKTSTASRRSSRDIVRNGIVLKQCPVTCGRPTRMTAASFARACAAQRKRSESFSFQGTKEIARVEEKTTWCDVCQGEQRPAELAIIPLAEIRTLATKRPQQPPPAAPVIASAARQSQPLSTKKGEKTMASKRTVAACESCGNKKSLSNCSGNLVCGNCAPLYGAINRRPDVVLKAIRHLRPNLLAELGEQLVPVQLESEALKLIAEAVGYEGTSGDELVETIRALREAKEQASQVDNLVEKHSLPDVTRALDCAAHEWDMAAIQTAALLDDAVRQHVIDAGLINQQRNELGALAQAFDRVTNDQATVQAAVDRLASENSVLANQLSEMEQIATNLETTATVNEQIFARLRELIDGNGLSNAELPRAFESVLSNAADSGRWLAMIQGNGQQVGVPAASPIDSHLLDLVLEYPGIPLERIALIREAV